MKSSYEDFEAYFLLLILKFQYKTQRQAFAPTVKAAKRLHRRPFRDTCEDTANSHSCFVFPSSEMVATALLVC